MEEGEGLLLEDEEDGVDEFEVLGEVVHLWRLGRVWWRTQTTYIIQDDQLVRPTTVGAADGVEDAIAHDFWQELLNEEGEKTAADDGEVEVVDHEGTVEHKGLSFLHQLSSAEDDDIVCRERRQSLRQG